MKYTKEEILNLQLKRYTSDATTTQSSFYTRVVASVQTVVFLFTEMLKGECAFKLCSFGYSCSTLPNRESIAV